MADPTMSQATRVCPQCGLIFDEVEQPESEQTAWWGLCPRCKTIHPDRTIEGQGE